jgi:SAM-dependent methyltransferase
VTVSESDPAPSFDRHADSLEAQCAEGLAVSGESKEFFARGRIECLRSWLEKEGIPAPRRVLDYGCGVGDATAVLGEVFPEAKVEGVDPSSRCIERANERYGSERVSFSVLAADSGGPVLEAADVVHVNGVLHHVKVAERPRFAAELAGRLAPEGVLALFENNPFNPGTRLVMSRIPFDRDAVRSSPRATRRLLGGAGLEPLATRYLFVFPRFLRMLRPLERWLSRVPLGAQYVVFGGRRES